MPQTIVAMTINEKLNSRKILPIVSDPTDEDTDGDTLNDKIDILPLKFNFKAIGTLDYIDELIELVANERATNGDRVPNGFDFVDNDDAGYYDYYRSFYADIIIKKMKDDMNLMNDIPRSQLFEFIPFDNWDRYCVEFNKNINIYGVRNQEIHYFRNKLNRVPTTLEEMICQYDEWELMSALNSGYHMYGENGGYNLKFISNCGKYEAVYNIKGELLTDRCDNLKNQSYVYNQDIGVFDPDNMGTYNYCGVNKDVLVHYKLDVKTYKQYGNILGYSSKNPYWYEYDGDVMAQQYRKFMALR